MGNTLRSICSKCIGSFHLRTNLHATRLSCGTSPGAEIVANIFGDFLEKVILKMDFKHAFHSHKRHQILIVFSKRRQMFDYRVSSYNRSSNLLMVEHIVSSQHGCELDLEGPAVFSNTIQDLMKQTSST